MDRFTKIILTVIALALIVIAYNATRYRTPGYCGAYESSDCHVYIDYACGRDKEHPCYVSPVHE